MSELLICANNKPLHTAPLFDDSGYTVNALVGSDVTKGMYLTPPETDKLLNSCFKILETTSKRQGWYHQY